jgi:hypothetical protein
MKRDCEESFDSDRSRNIGETMKEAKSNIIDFVEEVMRVGNL